MALEGRVKEFLAKSLKRDVGAETRSSFTDMVKEFGGDREGIMNVVQECIDEGLFVESEIEEAMSK